MAFTVYLFIYVPLFTVFVTGKKKIMVLNGNNLKRHD